MNRSDRLIFKTWEQEVITAEKEKALKITEVTINNIQAKSQVADAANQEGKAIDARIQAANQDNQAKLQEKQKAMEKWNTELVKLLTKIEHNKSLLRDKEVVTILQTAYDNHDF
jgi:hypothetical protein